VEIELQLCKEWLYRLLGGWSTDVGELWMSVIHGKLGKQ